MRAQADAIENRLALVARVDIAAGLLTIKLDAARLAQALTLDPCEIDADALISTHLFQYRKRGVETKIVLADAPPARDETLLRNIARAHLWYERIKTGDSFAAIAADEHTTTRRVQQLIQLAFLSPTIIRDAIDGTHSLGFTTEYCLRRGLPSDWQDQRKTLATL